MARTRTWTARAAEVERERTRQVSRIGNNLSQIARWANTHKGAAEAVEVLAASSPSSGRLRRWSASSARRTTMHIKFLAHGTGSARAAAKYLLGEQDASGKPREGVEVLRGNPGMVAAVADSLEFEHR